MRQRLSQKKTARLANETGLDLVGVLVRGDTDHRKDLLLRGGEIWNLYKNGDLEKDSCRHSL